MKTEHTTEVANDSDLGNPIGFGSNHSGMSMLSNKLAEGLVTGGGKFGIVDVGGSALVLQSKAQPQKNKPYYRQFAGQKF